MTTKSVLPEVTEQMRDLLNYAEDLRQNHPDIWAKGGNIQGNDSYETLKKIVRRGHFTDADADFIQTWEAWKARHGNHKNIEGMVASLKWLAVPEVGWKEMKAVIEAEKAKEEK